MWKERENCKWEGCEGRGELDEDTRREVSELRRTRNGKR